MTLTEVFHNQKRINVHEHTVKIELYDSFRYQRKEQEGRNGRDGGKLSYMSARAVSVYEGCGLNHDSSRVKSFLHDP